MAGAAAPALCVICVAWAPICRGYRYDFSLIVRSKGDLIRKLILGGIVAATALTLLSATPAMADTTVTYDVPADTLVDLTESNFIFGAYEPFAPAGAITFPIDFTIVGELGSSGRASGLTLSAAPADGCVRTVDSVTVAFSVSSSAAAQSISPALTFGTPNELAEDATYGYAGDGEFSSAGGIGAVVLAPSEVEQSGVITVAYDAPVDYSTALLALGFPNFQSEQTDWSLTSAVFAVNDTCPDVLPADPAAPAVPAGPAAVAAVAGPAAAPPVAPTLANTGSDLAPFLGTADTLLLAGIAGTAIAATVGRRRAAR